MADQERAKTPPQRTTRPGAAQGSQLSPDQVRRIEENRLRAKALRERHLAAQAAGTKRPASSISTSTSTSTTTVSSFARSTPETSRNGTSTSNTSEATKIEPARKFRKYIEHDLSSMADTKGGFLAREDDPFNKGMRWSDLDTADGEKRPPHMSEKEWERLRLLRELRRNKSGPFEPGISALDQGANKERPQCRECNSLDVDFLWNEVFKVAVCGRCKEKMPEKYSLLTKTEVKDDYLLTDEECRDAELLPHLNKPNPHKSHWHDMMLFLRLQVEEYALGPKRWGSAEALDAEFEKRQKETKERKEKKFRKGLLDLKRKTRGEQFRRARKGEGPKGFGDKVGGRHEHEWGQSLERADGATVKRCEECGMEVEELEF